MKILILNILLLFSIPYLYAQPFNCSLTPSNTDRNVFWLHGYQGSAENFISASEDVECTFEAASNRIAYNTSQQSLAVSANTVEAAIRNISSSQSNHNKERNFIIAHSMGGLVAREMGALTDNNGNELFDGLITFGTPHQGAAIADTYVNDKQSILDFLQDACKALAKGPLEEGVNNNGILGKVVVGLGFVGSYTNLGCDAGVDIGFPLIIDFLEVGVEQELTTTNASNIPAMATSNNAVFYGIEDGHNDGTLSARMAGAILNDANNDYPLYGADASDAEGIATIQTGLDRYIDGANHPNNRIANSYQVGADWFDEIDPFWQEVTGVSEIQFVKTGCE